MNKKLITLITVAISLFFNSSFAGSLDKPLKSSATIQSTCSISSTDINFGVIASPLGEQASYGDLSVFCNNGTTYNVGLSYSGVYGQGNANYTGDYWNFSKNEIYNFQTGGSTYYFDKYVMNKVTGKAAYSKTVKVDSSVGTRFSPAVTAKLDGGGCTWAGNVCSVGTQPYSYGIMKGMVNTNNLAYSIFVPGNPNLVWNSGNGSYSATGNGTTQVIPMLAKIVPTSSTSLFPAPDIYNDIVTANIAY